MLCLLRAVAVARQSLAMLFAVLLLHANWMTGSAACEAPPTSQTQTSQTQTSQTPAQQAQAPDVDAAPTHLAHSVAHVHVAQALAPNAPTDLPPAHHDPASSVGCPMAMACAVNAMIADAPSFATTTVTVARATTLGTSDMPRSTRVAPETPPPRG